MFKEITQCPVCKKEKKKSKFYISQMGTSTLMGFEAPFYDEEGKYHYHNPNLSTVQWWCSRGHQGTITYGNKCPNCDFGIETKISIDTKNGKEPQKKITEYSR